MIFVGDDWSEDHHDVCVLDEAGKRLARQKLPEGVAGVATLHGLLAGADRARSTVAAVNGSLKRSSPPRARMLASASGFALRSANSHPGRAATAFLLVVPRQRYRAPRLRGQDRRSGSQVSERPKVGKGRPHFVLHC